MSLSGYRAFALHDAVLDEGTVLLEASAGTGKTYTLTGVLVRMVLEGTVERIEQALVVTFTVAAADELKNRLRAALQRAHRVCCGRPDDDPFFAGLVHHGRAGAKRLRRALDEFDQASVMTIHGFCKRLLDEAAFESEQPFEVEFTVDELPLWHAAAGDALRLLRRYDSPMFGAVLQHLAITPESLIALYRSWQRYPEAALTPAEPQLSVHLTNLRAAVHRAKGQWDDELLELLTSFEWLSGKDPTNGNPRRYFGQQARQLAEHPELGLKLLEQLASSRLARTLKRNSRPHANHPFFQLCDEVVAELQRVQQHLQSELLLHMHARLDRHKRERRVATFDDLLARTHEAITDGARGERLLATLRDRYRVALIDEFQDTDARQYTILAEAFRNRPLFLIGDPKQSIYAFRGADLATYLRAADDAVDRRTLAKNFRSSRGLVAAVNQLFGGPAAFVEPRIRMPRVEAHAGPDELLVHEDAGAPLRFRLLEYETNNRGGARALRPTDARRRIALDVVDEIRRLLDGPARIDHAGRRRPILPQDIAVLTRRNVEAVLIQEQLRAAGVVSVIGRAGDVFQTDELVELERVLQAVLRPNDLRAMRAAMATRLWGIDAVALVQLEADAVRFEQQWAQLDRWRQLWLHRGFVVMKEQLLQDLDVEARMLQRSDGERRLTNLQQLCEMLHQAEHQHRLSPEGLLHWLAHERDNSDEIDYQRRELRLESDEDAVQIMTMHGSKGLQYEIVFCPFLWDGRPAPHRNVAVLADDDGSRRRFAYELDEDDPAWLQSEAERLAEDVRLCYVALTRARRRCYVHWGPIGYGSNGYHRSALAWLLQPDNRAVQQGDWPRTWAQHYKDRSGQLGEDLVQLATRSNGTIGVDIVPSRAAQSAPDPAAAGAEGDRAPIAPSSPAPAHGRPELPRRQPLAMHSFSSLVKGRSATALAGESVTETELTTTSDEVTADEPVDAGRGILGFARGAIAGQCLHEILEHVDLSALDDAATAVQIERSLVRHDLLTADAHPGAIDPIAAVADNLRNLAAARVTTDGPTLRELCGRDRLAEWKFTLPVAVPDLVALAALFEASSSAVARRYAARLTTLPTQRFAGFLTGFVDLLAAHGDRFWILDWKSNYLGSSAEGYDQTALQEQMHEHDYVLQYHLYALALHRHLQSRLADYDYDRHFGGVCYAFLRGARPDSNNGMFCDRPPRELVLGIDAWAKAGETS